jgi:glycosyltransferase involved in cell wall biosynthesis
MTKVQVSSTPSVDAVLLANDSSGKVSMRTQNRLLVFIVAYNAEKTIAAVLDRIPESLAAAYDTSVLVIDDASADRTADLVRQHVAQGYWCPTIILRNPVNLGYGGNQKVGYRYASDNGFDLVALVHGDGQYAPECLPDLLAAMAADATAGVVLGSRMINKRDAIKGGMPYYKFLGNMVLTRFQNGLLGSDLAEFHTGYRLYRVAALKGLPLELNTDDFHFDTEILVQLLFSGHRVVEVPILTHYGEEVCHVNGLAYALAVMRASLKARLIRLGIFFDPKYDLGESGTGVYVDKLAFASTHSAAFSLIPQGSRVVDLGCADGHLARELSARKDCRVTAVDQSAAGAVPGCEYLACDLNSDLPPLDWDSCDLVVLLDVIEHLHDPEGFLDRLRECLSSNREVRVIISSGNVCFFVTRLMMLLGQFNYGRRGILDITHVRLLTVASLRRLLRYAGYEVLDAKYIPAPYPLAIGLGVVSRALLAVNGILARLLPGLFAYQSLYVIRPRPSLHWLLKQAMDSGKAGVVS